VPGARCFTAATGDLIELLARSATRARIASALRANSDEVGSVVEWSGMTFGC